MRYYILVYEIDFRAAANEYDYNYEIINKAKAAAREKKYPLGGSLFIIA